MIAAAKAKPGSFNYASVGVGSATHLSVEQAEAQRRFEAVHVPFRGGPEALTEVMAGRVESISARSTRRCRSCARASFSGSS